MSAGVPGMVDLYTAKFFELERHLSGARCLDDFVFRIGVLLKRIGITEFSHAYARSVHNILDPIGNFSRESTDKYAREGFQHDDLATQFLLQTPAPLFRSTIDNHIDASPIELPAYRGNKEVVKWLKSQGINDIFSLPIIGVDGYCALFSLVSVNCPSEKFREIVNAHMNEITALAALVDQVGVRKFGPKFRRDKTNHRLPIAVRPLELIEILANKDLTLNEAAEVLNISISTANQHIAAAKKALCASTTHGLILAAQREGLISVER